MEKKNKSLKPSEYYWFWLSNQSKNDTELEWEFVPYDFAISQKIEENFKKGIFSTDIKIGSEDYYIDTRDQNSFKQRNKIDKSKIRHVTRAQLEDSIRKNRFTDTFDSSSFEKKLIKTTDLKQYELVTLKVCELFDDPKNYDSPFIFDSTNTLFNAQISIPNQIYQALKKKFYKKVEFTNLNGVRRYLKNEIKIEAEECTKSNKHKNRLNSNYIEQADYFLQIIDQDSDSSLEEKLLFIYTLEGFIYYSLKSMLQDFTALNTNLNLFFILMLAATQILSTKNDKRVLEEICLNKSEGNYEFYRGAELPISLIKEIESSIFVSDKLFVNKEFLSTTYELNKSLKYLSQAEKLKNNVSVLLTYRVSKELVDRHPNLFCYLENLSNHPYEKEVIFSPSTIFKLQNVMMNNHYGCYQVILDFVPNNSNNNKNKLTDFSNEIERFNPNLTREEPTMISDAFNTSIPKIDSRNYDLVNEGDFAIAEAIKVMKSQKEVDLSRNKIDVEGAIEIAKALKVNKTLEFIRLDENNIGNEGISAIALALRTNSSLQNIQLNSNRIGNTGAKALAEALKVNICLKRIDLSGNLIKDEGAFAIAEALKINCTLENLDLKDNKIGDEGAAAILEALNTNKSIKIIDLDNNSVRDELDLYRKFFGYRLKFK